MYKGLQYIKYYLLQQIITFESGIPNLKKKCKYTYTDHYANNILSFINISKNYIYLKLECLFSVKLPGWMTMSKTKIRWCSNSYNSSILSMLMLSIHILSVLSLWYHWFGFLLCCHCRDINDNSRKMISDDVTITEKKKT